MFPQLVPKKESLFDNFYSSKLIYDRVPRPFVAPNHIIDRICTLAFLHLFRRVIFQARSCSQRLGRLSQLFAPNFLRHLQKKSEKKNWRPRKIDKMKSFILLHILQKLHFGFGRQKIVEICL